MISDTYCKRSKQELVIRTIEDTVEGALCCKMLKTVDMKNPNALEKIKQDLDNGIKNSHCDICWKHEEQGIRSWRQIGNSIKLRGRAVDLFLDTTCDAACIYCNHTYSSKWKQEVLHATTEDKNAIKNIHPIDNIITNNIDKEQKFQTVLQEIENLGKNPLQDADEQTIITLLGGEPLLTPFVKSNTIKDIVEAFYKHSNKRSILKVVIHTNGNTTDAIMEKTFTLIKDLETKYERLEFVFCLSMESVGKLSEYIRYGVSWNQFDKNVDRIMMNNIRITFNMTTSIVSFLDTPNFIKYVFEKAKTYNQTTMCNLNLVRYPKSMSIALLSKEYNFILDELKSIANEYKEYWLHDRLLFNFLEQVDVAENLLGSDIDDNVIQKGKSVFEYFKRARKMNLYDYNSEIAEYFGLEK